MDLSRQKIANSVENMINIAIVSLLWCVTLTDTLRCSNDSRDLPKYYLIQKCHRSKLGTMAKGGYITLSSCRRFAAEKKALAFNFSPQDARYMTNATKRKDLCELLNCAEVSGGLSLVNDTRYHYYSAYAKPIPDINSTCVPATGMFHILDRKLNYQEASATCKDANGVLADVTSDQRTESLGQLIAGAHLDAAYVGIRRLNSSKFYSTNGDSLECSTYRAWAPGHPRKSYLQFECAIITRFKTWQSVSCKKRFPALCELLPGGPYIRGSIFPTTKEGNKIDDGKIQTIT